MKKLLLIVGFTVAAGALQAQSKDYDSSAIVILDRMSDVIGDLSSVSFTMQTQSDIMDTGNLITTYSKDEVYMTGPDKMMVNVMGTKGHKAFFYNGTTMSYYYLDENNYAVTDAPPTILQAIDSIHDTYGIQFPAADFFYPTFADDFLNYCDKIDFLGREKIEGVECFHILGVGKEMNIQLWMTADATTLPKKMVINYKNDKKIKRYESTFTGWNLNPVLPAAIFEFSPPPGAHQVYLMPVAITK